MRAAALVVAVVLVLVVASAPRPAAAPADAGGPSLTYYALNSWGSESCGSRASGEKCFDNPRGGGARVEVSVDYRLQDNTYLGSDYPTSTGYRTDVNTDVTNAVVSTVAGNIGWQAGWGLGDYLGGLAGTWAAASTSTAAWTWGSFAAAAGPWVGAIVVAGGAAA